MNQNHFPILILLGRPASGKSEIIDFLNNTPSQERLQRFHIAELDIIDDFPMLWIWFEEDHILSEDLGASRLHTDPAGYFKYPYLWNLLIRRLGLEYQKRLRDDPNHHAHTTTLVEFSRGSEHGGYNQAFQHLPLDLLQQSAVMYVNVSFEESLRKNRLRFNPNKPGSILEHALPDEKLKRQYRYIDWEKFSALDPCYLQLDDIQIPYAVFENEDDITTGKPEILEVNLVSTLDQLWKLYINRDR
ncbi:hypothetical protein ACFLV7_09640 [Chloroflexota bacterium]